MESMTELAVAVDSRDPEIGLAAVAALRRLTDELEALHVSNARAQGRSWAAIAGALGVRRQSVHKKYARRVVGEADRRGTAVGAVRAEPLAVDAMETDETTRGRQ